MGMQGLIDGLEISLFVHGPVLYQVVHPYFDNVLNEHPYDVIGPDQADQAPWQARNQPPQGTHEYCENLGAHDGPEECRGRERRYEKKFLGACQEEHEMPARDQLQEEHGLDMGLVDLYPLLPFGVFEPLPSDEQQTEGLSHSEEA